MREAIAYASSLESISILKSKIEGLRDEVDHLYPVKLFSKKTNERKGYALAIEHALDVVDSIEKRFVTGSADSSPRARDGYWLLDASDEDLF